MVDVLSALYREAGPVARLRTPALALGDSGAGAGEAVVIFDPEVYMQVHRASGSCPWGATDALWPLHRYFSEREKSGAELHAGQAMSFGTGDWHRVRRAMQPAFMSPAAAAQYMDGLDSVARDASRLLGEHHGGAPVVDLQAWLQRLSFEMITRALFGRRLGALESDEPLLGATVRSMECASGMLMSPLQMGHAVLSTPLWREWTLNLDVMLARAHEHVDASMAMMDTGEKNVDTGGYVGTLLRGGRVDIDGNRCERPRTYDGRF